MAPPTLRDRYPDVNLYIFDFLLVRKPRAFHISIKYASGEECELLYLKPRYRRVDSHPDDAAHSNGPKAHADGNGSVEAKNDTGTDVESGGGGCCKAPTTRTLLQHEAAKAKDMAGRALAHYRSTHGVTDDGVGEEIEDDDMIGCCCDCCSRARCGWKWLNHKACGRFPQVSTLNQFLTSKQKRALHRVAYECMLDANTQHPAFFQEAVAASQRPAAHQQTSAQGFGSGVEARGGAGTAASAHGERPKHE